MAELPHRPPLPPQNALSAPSPLPTPPSSTSTIPPLCFPSPTSVAHVVNEQQEDTRKKAIRDKIRENVPVRTTSQNDHSRAQVIKGAAQNLAQSREGEYDKRSNSPTDESFSANLENLEPKQNVDDHERVFEHEDQEEIQPRGEPSGNTEKDDHDIPLFERTDLANSAPSNTLYDVTKTKFAEALEKFVAYQPPNSEVRAPVLASRMRELLDHLDGLVEKPSLRLTNKLFDALTHPRCLAMLLFLLSDISSQSTPVMQDVRKSYRYPYLVAKVHLSGNTDFRESFMGSTDLVAQLLSFLDGRIPLSCPDPSRSQPILAHRNPIIVGNVVEILVSYMGTSTESLLQVFENRPNFVPAVVKLLDIGSVPQLLTALIPDRCVQDVETMDHCKVSFDLSLTKALTVLSASTIFHHLSDAFIEAAQMIFSVATNSDDEHDEHDKCRAEQLAYSVTQVYSTLVKKTIRAVRINRDIPECRYLNVYGTPETASTAAQILLIGTELFRETGGDSVSTLDLGLSLMIQLLKYVEEDKHRRVASVSGQPPPLDTTALEVELRPLLQILMEILIDMVKTGRRHSSIRLRILELFVECTRVLSESMMGFIDELKFGGVALKVVLLFPRNSLIQHVVCRGVETGLISPSATATSAKHWLTRTKLAQKILKVWDEEKGDDKWNSPREAQNAPVLSALVHMACCVQHYHAIQAERSEEQKRSTPMPTLKKDLLSRFESFCTRSLTPILSEEIPLQGPKPRRRSERPIGGFGRSFGLLARTRRTGSGGALPVKSPSAHRFGYVAPSSSLRSRFDEVFVDGEQEVFEAVGFSPLTGAFDAGVSDALG